MSKRKLFLWVILVFLMAGCATWVKTTGNYVNSSEKYSLDLPWGWMMHKGKELILTRDGVWLENIIIKRYKVEEKLEYTKKKFVKGMLPEEISQVALDNLKSNSQIGNLEVIENKPFILSGRDGFRLVYTFTTSEDLKKKGIYYGLGDGNLVYEISYTGTLWHYFDREVDAFERSVRSFKIIE